MLEVLDGQVAAAVEDRKKIKEKRQKIPLFFSFFFVRFDIGFRRAKEEEEEEEASTSKKGRRSQCSFSLSRFSSRPHP